MSPGETSGIPAVSSDAQRYAQQLAQRLADDPDLARVVEAWPMLTYEQRAAVLAIVGP